MSQRPLSGCRVLVTRPEGQAGPLIDAITAAGGEALHYPALRITGRDADEIRREVDTLPGADIALFVSRNAVRFGYDAIRPLGARIGAVGPATRAALEQAGATVDLFPGTGFDSEGLLALPGMNQVDGKTVVIVRGDSGRGLLGETLAARGATVHHLCVYRRERAQPAPGRTAGVGESLARGELDFVVVMSAQTLDHLLALLPDGALGDTPLVAPGERVIQTALERVPGSPALMASGPTPADIVNALADAWRSGKHS